jgi:hypothetical protein
VFVTEQLSVIEIGRFEVGGSAFGNRPDIGGEHFGILLLKTLIPFAQGFRDGAGYRLPCG